MREFTGLIEWMSGLLVQLKPFAGQLWAALYSDRAEGKIWRAQVETALVWLNVLFRSSSCLFAVRHLRPASTQAVIASDASPFGGGALLFILPADARITIQTHGASNPLGLDGYAVDEERRTQSPGVDRRRSKPSQMGGICVHLGG